MAAPLRVAFATSEYAPLVKTGGLGDVAGALPAALRREDVDVRVVLPGYPGVLSAVQVVGRPVAVPPLARIPSAELLRVVLPGDVPGWIVRNAALYERAGGPYQDETGQDWGDNALRFGLLARVGAWLADAPEALGWQADVIHAHDWQTGLAPAYAALLARRRAPSVITIHNLAFQGVFDPHWVTDLGLPPESFTMNGVEFHGRFSFLKAGLYYADAITTVSPTYAEEIQRAPGGVGFEGLLAGRRDSLTGILNGIDTTTWNPRTDAFLAATYDEAHLARKSATKRELQREVGLAADVDVLLLGVVARLSAQKGLDLLADIGPALAGLPVELVILGSGEPALEQRLRDLAAAFPSRIAVVTRFDERLAHRIEAGADAFVMPSRFEPCGLNQMYSQRYGTPPIVHATGGLVDSVVDCTPASLAAGTATGFRYGDATAAALLAAVQRAHGMYKDRTAWRRLQRNGMARDFGWGSAAAGYAGIYRRLAARPR